MKVFLTTKKLKSWYPERVFINNIQHILQYFNASYYHYGVYGWNYDTYIFDGIAIITGYRSYPSFILNSPKYERQKEVNDKMIELEKTTYDYETRKNYAEKLLRELIEEVK